MNRQEVFDRVATHLLTQMKQSIDTPYNYCMYRSPDGLSCAIGVLIADDAYLPELEGKVLSSAAIIEALAKSGIAFEPGDDLFTTQLQIVHDGYELGTWREKLQSIAKAYGLTFPEGI